MLLRSLAQTIKDPALKTRWIALFEGQSIETGIFVESVTPTFTRVGAAHRFYGGISIEFPEFAALDNIIVNLYEDHAYRATQWLEDWKSKIFDIDTGEYGLPVDYMKTLTIALYPINESSPVITLAFERVWPLDHQNHDYNYMESDGRVTVSSTLATARMKIETAQ